MARGDLRIYLGAAPGVGKTFGMLNEGRRRAARGTDVVIGVVETHGRVNTAEQIGDLEVVPRRSVEHRGAALTEMDLDAILRRAPEVVLVDELAHTNAPGSRNEKRWEDIEELLDAGIDVISTVNIQHLESLNDVVEAITGIGQRETVPDAWVRQADQIELVDMTPEALRRRMAHGNVYPAERIDAALGNYFREGNLSALRELALLWTADRVDEALTAYRGRHGIERPWETRERVVVSITGAPGGEQLIRRAARMATRARAELVGVHVRTVDGVRGEPSEKLAAHRALLAEMGGRYLEITGPDVGRALLRAAEAENATQLVLGASRRSRWAEITQGSVIPRIIRESGPIDVHIISTTAVSERSPRRRHRGDRRRPALPAARRRAGWAVAVGGPLLATALLSAPVDPVSVSSVFLGLLLVVLAAAAVGGAGPALVATVASTLCANWFFLPPVHTWTIRSGDNLVALLVFGTVAVVVSAFVSAVDRRSWEAAQARASAETLAGLAAVTVAADPLDGLVARLSDALDLDDVAVLAHVQGGWQVLAAEGDAPPSTPEEASFVLPVDDDTVIAFRVEDVAADDQQLIHAFADLVAAAVQSRRARREAAAARELAEADELRVALLVAVSHDLKTPLASIKALASSLVTDEVEWSRADTIDFARSIVGETDRLAVLVDNLLDMSRLTTGALTLRRASVGIDEVVAAALDDLGVRARGDAVQVDVPEALPTLATDPALLQRAIANLVDNALAWTPAGRPVRVEAGIVLDALHVRVVDEGPGIPPSEREAVFRPFQRRGDRSHGAGVGLGLAVAQGFVRVLGGEIVVEDTPGGGTTMTVILPLSPPATGRTAATDAAHEAASEGDAPSEREAAS